MWSNDPEVILFHCKQFAILLCWPVVKKKKKKKSAKHFTTLNHPILWRITQPQIYSIQQPDGSGFHDFDCKQICDCNLCRSMFIHDGVWEKKEHTSLTTLNLNLNFFIQRMTVLGHSLIFQPVPTSVPYTQTCTYNNDTITTLKTILTLHIFHKKTNPNIQTNVFDMALKLSMIHGYNEKRNRIYLLNKTA